jgi:octaheme c-type cytochrome (tetrathionate reductase family)
LGATVVVVLGLVGLAFRGTASAHAQKLSTAVGRVPFNPTAHQARPHLDHSAFFKEELKSPQEVTKKCISCHESAAPDVMKTAHWLWLSGDVERDGKLIRTGKRNLMNNFCISVSGNQASCSRCHAGYGMENADYDFTRAENVDCLVCHDGSGSYSKDKKGLPGAKVNLAAVAGSVRMPYRENCGICHFNGGGGMGVKHGDLDDSLINATEDTDVHMGRLNFQCVDCHRTEHHLIPGKINATYTSATEVRRFDCADCHSATPHTDAQLNKHVARVACQTCHIPAYARKFPTKMEWDWEQAGDSKRKDDPHEYLKIKGSFRYDESVAPEYAWYNGRMDRYVMGDKVTSDDQAINQPLGSRDDPKAKIYPFKIHRAKQIFDPINKVLIPPITSGEGGYWTKFDWKSAAQMGMETAGLPYSGQYGFTKTHMYWSINHMTTPAKKALQCTQCHSSDGRMNWKSLGYDRDPAGGKPYGS